MFINTLFCITIQLLLTKPCIYFVFDIFDRSQQNFFDRSQKVAFSKNQVAFLNLIGRNFVALLISKQNIFMQRWNKIKIVQQSV